MSINESVLLLDEALIDAESGVEREVQPGKKNDFVMEPDRDKSWEYGGAGMSKCVCIYGTTLYDDLTGKYRMWYAGRMGPHWRYEEQQLSDSRLVRASHRRETVQLQRRNSGQIRTNFCGQ